MSIDSTPQISQQAIERYLSRRSQDLETARSALAQQDWKTLGILGHKMQGSARTFGFPQLEGLGSRLESAALQQDAHACAMALDELAGELSKRLPEHS